MKFSHSLLPALVLSLPLMAAAQSLPYSPVTGNTQNGNAQATPSELRAPACAGVTGNPFANCSFETGDFSSWLLTDIATPFFAATVGAAGVDPGFGFFISAPTDGTFAALNGFDGGGPGTIELAQDVSLAADAANLQFDFRAAYDLLNFGATVDREFRVEIQPSGGGAPLASSTLLVATAGTFLGDTGDQSAAVDVSAFAGQAVRVAFIWVVPENLSGPAFFQLDNVSVAAGLPAPVAVPALDTYGLLASFAVLLLMGGLSLRRRS